MSLPFLSPTSSLRWLPEHRGLAFVSDTGGFLSIGDLVIIKGGFVATVPTLGDGDHHPRSTYYSEKNASTIDKIRSGFVTQIATTFPTVDLPRLRNVLITPRHHPPLPQEILFSCKARIVDIVSHQGKCELSGTTCMFTMDHAAIADPWKLCSSNSSSNVERHRVELLVDDVTNYATLSVTYKDILKLTERNASHLLADEVNSDVGNDRSGALEQLRGRVYVFHVLVAEKFMTRTCPFTVCGMSEFVGEKVQQLYVLFVIRALSVLSYGPSATLQVIVELARKCFTTQLGNHSVNISANIP
ncbi:unnamed protein product [Cochlearia groenlandica]